MNAQTGVRPTAPDRPPRWRRWAAADAVLAAVALILFVAVLAWLRPPASVGQLTMVNTSPVDIDVDVAGEDGGGWTPAGTVESRSTQVSRQVLDQGDVWIFRFTGQGEDGGQLRVSRAELKAADWRLTIPDAVGERLQAEGASPNP